MVNTKYVYNCLYNKLIQVNSLVMPTKSNG